MLRVSCAHNVNCTCTVSDRGSIPVAPLAARQEQRSRRNAKWIAHAAGIDVASAGVAEPPAVTGQPSTNATEWNDAATASLPPQITRDLIQGLLSFYRSQLNEYDYWLSEDLIEGEIPAELHGTLFRNGPGQLEIFGARINQPFDGDGMVSRFTLVDGKAHFRNRYVRTQGFLEEQEAGRMLYAGAFATGNPAGKWLNNPMDFVVKNVANTGVLQWAGRLFSLHESGLPYELNPESMSTLGETDLGGSIEGKGPFAAHYRIMHEEDGSKRWVTFGAKVQGLDGLVTFYEYGEDARLLYKTVHKVEGGGFGFFHDLAVTERHYVLLQNPTRLDFRKLFFEYIFGRCSIAECIVYDEKLPAKVHLVPRPGYGGAAQAKEFETAPFFSFHHVNAFEQSDQVIIDTLGWNKVSFKTSMDTLTPEYFTGGQRSELSRMAINTATGDVRRRSLSHRTAEFSTMNPAFNGKPYRHAYVGASAIDDPIYWGPNQVPPTIQQVLMKATFPEGGDVATAQPTTEVWAHGPMSYAQEPVFAPRPGGSAEDDGWILMLVNNAESQRTDLCILDAQRISDGPVATLHLPHHIPPGLHGSWAEAAVHIHPPATMPAAWHPSFSTIRH